VKITYIYPEEAALWKNIEWRCYTPARAINHTGRHKAYLIGARDFGKNTPQARVACERSDVLVIYRNLWGNTLSGIQHWRARDKIVIADFDEAYQLLGEHDPAYPFWFEGKAASPNPAGNITPPPVVQFKWGLQLANGATVPSKRLADDWRAFTRLEWLPGYIDLQKYMDIHPQAHDEVILGWSGPATRLRSFEASGLLAALQELLPQRPDVRLLLCCDQQVDAESLGLPPQQVLEMPVRSEADWPQPLAYMDIGLHPLEGAFDQRSGWPALLEWMALKIPWAASRGPACLELNHYGWLVENTAGAWLRILQDMVDHLADYRAEAARAAYMFGISQGIEENVSQVLETYARLAGPLAAVESQSRPIIPTSTL